MRRLLGLWVLLASCGGDEAIAFSDRRQMPNFALPDVNPNSQSFDTEVSVAAHSQSVTAWYFSRATCSYCRSQLGHLDHMQTELLDTPVPVRILGVNAADAQSANDLIVEGRSVAWLQDNPEVDAWAAWEVQWRDVVVLDESGQRLHVYNLTEHDLADKTYYQALLHALRNAATP